MEFSEQSQVAYLILAPTHMLLHLCIANVMASLAARGYA